MLTALLMATTGTAGAAPTEESAIRSVEDAQAAAWNAHDAHGYAALFVDDAILINMYGWRWNGREEVERKLAQGFAFVFARSRLQIDDVDVRLIAPDAALAYVRWSLADALDPDGSEATPSRGVQTQLLRLVDGGWRIQSLQDTASLPEHPFATAAGAPKAVLDKAAPADQPRRHCIVANRDGKCLIGK